MPPLRPQPYRVLSFRLFPGYFSGCYHRHPYAEAPPLLKKLDKSPLAVILGLGRLNLPRSYFVRVSPQLHRFWTDVASGCWPASPPLRRSSTVSKKNWTKPDNDKTDVPQMLGCQASDSLNRTQSEALCHQHKETHRSAQRIRIFFLVYSTYFSDAFVCIQFYDFCLLCGKRSQTLRISFGHLLAHFGSSSSENLCAVNMLIVCTTKRITQVNRRFFIFRW